VSLNDGTIHRPCKIKAHGINNYHTYPLSYCSSTATKKSADMKATMKMDECIKASVGNIRNKQELQGNIVPAFGKFEN
jgi:hypothetical protein